MMFEMTAKNIANLNWHDVRRELPDNPYAEMTIAGHLDKNSKSITVGIAFFNPVKKTWNRIVNDLGKETGEQAFTFEDITDWVDGWAIIPDEMLEDDNKE